MKKVLHGKRVTQNECNREKVEHEMRAQKVQQHNTATGEKVRHEKSAT